MRETTAGRLTEQPQTTLSGPLAIVIGVGAESGVPAEDFEAAIGATLCESGLAPEGVRAIATIDRRAAEAGFSAWASQHHWPVIAYSAEQLAAVRVQAAAPSEGGQAMPAVGVCEPAAMLASGSQTLLVSKQKHGRVTVAIASCSDEPAEQAVEAATAAPPACRKVLFIGAGPGDAELLTLKGAKALAEADVVVYAGSLIPPGVLQHVRRGAVLHDSATLTLEDTHRLVSEAYHAGQRVVRLHSGDPSIYGAITEQMTLLDAEDIPYEIVPGVSSFQAVAARLGIEYTQPGVVQTLILTRPGGRTGLPPNESLAQLAQHGVTLCVFLGASLVGEVQKALLTSYPPTTPVAVAYRATWPDEELTLGTLADLVEMVQRPQYDRTILMVVGPSLQRQGKRSHVYDPSYRHRFRPGREGREGSVNNG